MSARRLRLRRREEAVQRTVPPPRAELSRVAAEQDWPRLRVFREEYANLITDERRFFWTWEVAGPSGRVLDEGRADSHAEALAVGLAALEQASVGSSRP